MKAFKVKVQFFSPDLIPTATGEFVVEAEDKWDAESKQNDNCLEWGYRSGEFRVVSVYEVE